MPSLKYRSSRLDLFYDDSALLVSGLPSIVNTHFDTTAVAFSKTFTSRLRIPKNKHCHGQMLSSLLLAALPLVNALPQITRSGRYLYADGARFAFKGIAYQEPGEIGENTVRLSLYRDDPMLIVRDRRKIKPMADSQNLNLMLTL